MQRTAARVRPHAGDAGFTLIELLGVIVIIGILIAFLVPMLGKAQDSAKIMATKGTLEELATAIAEYETEKGDYPTSSWKDEWGVAPNTTNLGAEALVIQLFGSKWASALSEDLLVNTDNDESKKALARFPKPTLFEIKDAWGNPIAYSHRRDYEHEQVYLLQDYHTKEFGESTFKAHQNPKTGEFWMPKKFQLVSAGPDAEFGTEDDITSWTETP